MVLNSTEFESLDTRILTTYILDMIIEEGGRRMHTQRHSSQSQVPNEYTEKTDDCAKKTERNGNCCVRGN
jgi:hypothetical protein